MKRIAFGIMILLLIPGLIGCMGHKKSINTNHISGNTLLARDNGEIQVAIMEDFQKTYYKLNDLQDYIDKEIASYNNKAGENKITVNNVEVKKKKAIMVLTYSGMDQYAAFNKATTAYFTGGAKKIPLNLPATLVTAEDKTLASTQEILQNENYKILILTEPYDIITDGKVMYYSENAVLSDDNKVQGATEGMTIVVFKH